MKFGNKMFTVAKLKYYFNIGYGETSFFKYLITFFGLASSDVKMTLWFGVAYGVLCFVIGYIICKSGFQHAQTEVANRFNPFVYEMRNKIKRVLPPFSD